MTLYTKIRPKTFDEVKGQEFTVNNLRMQSIRDKFFQVIILAGQYGAGKTTLARIVATAANCKNKDKNGNPCGTCDGCRSVSSGSVDFLEIDGASNTGVDHVRDLTDWLHERPLGKRKIVIIDEVHMLSRQAFNALLKTLEEPPAYALIIFAQQKQTGSRQPSGRDLPAIPSRRSQRPSSVNIFLKLRQNFKSVFSRKLQN